jgi:outer membrane protein assembly factor BamB
VWLHDLFAERGFDQRQAEEGVWWGRAASPLVRDGRVYVPVGGPAEGPFTTLAAYDAVNGDLLWECPGKQASYASPAWGEFHGVAQVLSVNEDYVTGHDPDTGKQLWEFEWPGKSGADANVSQAVPIDDRSLFISKGYGGDAAVYELAVSDEGAWSVKPRWSKKVLKTKFSNVSLKDGHAYGLDHGVLTCVDLETGRRAWKRGRYNYGQSLLVGDQLLIISEDGEIALAAANPEGFHEFGRVSALDGQTWNNPCLYGKYLLFRNATEAVCYELAVTAHP